MISYFLLYFSTSLSPIPSTDCIIVLKCKLIFFLILFSYIHSWSYEYLFSLQKYIIKIKRCLRLLQCSSLLVFFLFFQLFFSCPNDDYVLNTHDFQHARVRSGLHQLQGSYTSSREEEAVETAAVAASQTAPSQQEPPVGSTGHHTDGREGSGFKYFSL